MVPKSTRRLLLQQQCHLVLQIAHFDVGKEITVQFTQQSCKQSYNFALKRAYQCQESKFVIFSDSLSALQALEKLQTDHPLSIEIQDMLHKIEVDPKEIVSMWVPGHVGIRGTEAADRVAKEALDKEPTDDLMPFSDP